MVDKGYFEDIIDQLEIITLAMDRTGDTSQVHLLFRVAHNLKGSVAQMGMDGLCTEVHHLEDALDQLRRGRSVWSAEHYDLVMRVIDQVRSAVARTRNGEDLSVQRPAPRAEAAPRRVPAPEPWGLPLSPEEAAQASAAVELGQGLYRLEKLFKRGLPREVFNELPVLEDLREFGTLIAMHPTWEAYSEGPDEQVIKLLFASERSADELTEVLFDPLIVLQAPRSAPVAPARTSLRFLIVEDDPTVGGLLNYILRQHGDCTHCTTGQSGLAAFRQAWEADAPLDLVILDLGLPDLHGDAILKEIRSFESQRGLRDAASRCVVLINTGCTDLGQMRQSLEFEPDAYLIKPINIELILEKVATLKADRF